MWFGFRVLIILLWSPARTGWFLVLSFDLILCSGVCLVVACVLLWFGVAGSVRGSLCYVVC